MDTCDFGFAASCVVPACHSAPAESCPPSGLPLGPGGVLPALVRRGQYLADP
nr:hypothetical protein [Streptomyces phyllanthi]